MSFFSVCQSRKLNKWLDYNVQLRYELRVQCCHFSSKEAFHTAHSCLHVFQFNLLHVTSKNTAKFMIIIYIANHNNYMQNWPVSESRSEHIKNYWMQVLVLKSVIIRQIILWYSESPDKVPQDGMFLFLAIFHATRIYLNELHV